MANCNRTMRARQRYIELVMTIVVDMTTLTMNP
jgi:hypothetical protein